MDNTAPTPFHCRPFEHGADVVVHAATKWIGGHGTSIGGVIVDSGKFDWAAHSDRFPGLTKPDPAYHGAVWTEAAGPAAYIIRARTVLLRNTGGATTPMNSWLFLQGLETLHLRMERHSANALRVAEFLQGHDAVSWVSYPGLSDSPYKAVHDRIGTGHGYGGLLSFGVKSGRDGGRRFIESLEHFEANGLPYAGAGRWTLAISSSASRGKTSGCPERTNAANRSVWVSASCAGATDTAPRTARRPLRRPRRARRRPSRPGPSARPGVRRGRWPPVAPDR